MNEVSPSPDPMVFLLIREGVADLGEYLGMWATRSAATRPDAARAAATMAVERIDTTLQRLHSLRTQLVTEVRTFDAETSARVDELLRQRGSGVVGLPDEHGPGAAWERHDDPRA